MLFAGQDLLWHLEQVHGHDRATWIIDEWEFGMTVASALHMENRWVGSAAGMVRYYDTNERVDRWLESPEGKAQLALAVAEARRIT